jgi:outer membrane murein-binding lipoprotein Lpp
MRKMVIAAVVAAALALFGCSEQAVTGRPEPVIIIVE